MTQRTSCWDKCHTISHTKCNNPKMSKLTPQSNIVSDLDIMLSRLTPFDIVQYSFNAMLYNFKHCFWTVTPHFIFKLSCTINHMFSDRSSGLKIGQISQDVILFRNNVNKYQFGSTKRKIVMSRAKKHFEKLHGPYQNWKKQCIRYNRIGFK